MKHFINEVSYKVLACHCNEHQECHADVLLREYLHHAQATGYQDIFELEAIGLFLLLLKWPSVFCDSLWPHFYANSVSLASLVLAG